MNAHDFLHIIRAIKRILFDKPGAIFDNLICSNFLFVFLTDMHIYSELFWLLIVILDL